MENKQNSNYDGRFASVLGGGEYEDLLIALDFYNEFQAETGKALKEYIQSHCQTASEIKVLEAGPGTGITTIELLKADERVKVVSVDNEPKMLDAVKDKFATIEELKERVDFVMSDIVKFLESAEDESFDAFASVYTLHNFTPDFRRKTIELIVKKLKKGGVFINGDKYAREGEDHKKDFDGEINNYAKFETAAVIAENEGDMARASHLRKIREEWTHHAGEDEKNKITVIEQEEMFRELGLVDVKWGNRYDLVSTVRAIKS